MDSITEKNQQAYDDRADAWQAALSTNVSHWYLEKPAMVDLLPPTLVGKRVLCIGVGTGDELEEIFQRHPDSVVGIDMSVKLMDIARVKFPTTEFQQMDMLQLRFPDKSFDFIYSSLTFHYTRDWDILLGEVNRVLVDNGELLFSTHHPGYWGLKPATGNTFVNPREVRTTEHTAILPGQVGITYYNHKNEEAIKDAVEHAGFKIEEAFVPLVVEVALSDLPPEHIEGYKVLKTRNEKTPLFYIVKAQKL